MHAYTTTANYTVYLTAMSANGFQADATHVVSVQETILLGDINGDGTVDKTDAAALVDSFLLAPDNPAWNPNADINGDGTVDIYDTIILSAHFNQSIP